MRYKVWIFIFTAFSGLGGIACILQWLEIKPKDMWGGHVSITAPHWIWLLAAIALVGMSLATSGFLLFRPANALPITRNQEVERLQKELSHWQARYSTDITNALSDKAKAENRTLQLEAEQQTFANRLTALIHETLRFLQSQGPVPELKSGELGTERGKAFASEIEKRIHRVHSGFSLRLHPAIDKIVLELGEKGIFDYGLAQLMQNPAHSESDIFDIAQKLIALRDRLEVQEYGGEPHNLTYAHISTAEIKEILGAKGPSIHRGIESKGKF